ncbi:hypothetical protein [Klebsiella pneumoniae]|uniref:hypothetical protein n=1 Tax=Klebsiella pneumoniae TaxID=573 RepID=UPI0029492187|nr:hypothetical protein [Klebsiella pneumoniae]MDV5417828.1 hypothetical protein [Klebsiella pneumoniae]
MGKKVHIICGKCGSDEMNFVINGHCRTRSQNVASMSCSNCCELTGIAEWSEFNGRELKGEAVALSTPANVNALLLLRQAMDSVEYRLYGGGMSLSGNDAAELIDLQERAEGLVCSSGDQHE